MSDQIIDDEAPAAEPASESSGTDCGKVDVEKLADRVYRLMLADARLSRARGQSAGRRKGR